ncbi:uncharacterized protein NEMAJ01_1329 [Nematocida major]|uniref:uncharacterized protein n=1 Tax=Nematocida major TaxID=1912982 RepID=UPI002007F9CF|nr:uncharacterized protein NEMAJ01_1329 [Nematocida major]KAH9386433.1 hypothetical protein NEMAJ01_1329 [Nematocida major]
MQGSAVSKIEKDAVEDTEQEEDKKKEKDFLKLFEFVCVGDLQSLRNSLCVYEISHGKVFDLKIANKYGMYLIHSAAYYGQKEVIEFLLFSVSEVEEKDATLFEAITSDNISFESADTDNMSVSSSVNSCIVPVVFGHAKPSSSFINIRSLDNGATPLHFAALGGNRNNIILYLLSYGADPRLRDAKGLTPQELARAHGHKKTEKTISKYVQKINQRMEERPPKIH